MRKPLFLLAACAAALPAVLLAEPTTKAPRRRAFSTIPGAPAKPAESGSTAATKPADSAPSAPAADATTPAATDATPATTGSAAAVPADAAHYMAEEIDKIRTSVDKAVVIDGTIATDSASKAGTVHYLNFSQDWKKSVSLVFFPRKAAPITDDQRKAFVGKHVRASGTLTEHGGSLQIVINNVNQIELVP